MDEASGVENERYKQLCFQGWNQIASFLETMRRLRASVGFAA